MSHESMKGNLRMERQTTWQNKKKNNEMHDKIEIKRKIAKKKSFFFI